MNDDERKIEVSIMGKRYHVICSPSEEKKLTEAVAFLNSQIEELKHKMKNKRYSEATCSRDNLLAILAINLSHQILKMNTNVSSKVLGAEKLVNQIKSRLEQLDAANAKQKISEVPL